MLFRPITLAVLFASLFCFACGPGDDSPVGQGLETYGKNASIEKNDTLLCPPGYLPEKGRCAKYRHPKKEHKGGICGYAIEAGKRYDLRCETLSLCIATGPATDVAKYMCKSFLHRKPGDKYTARKGSQTETFCGFRNSWDAGGLSVEVRCQNTNRCLDIHQNVCELNLH